jgi:uncharacterized membrane protein YjgN (DUF898 family)
MNDQQASSDLTANVYGRQSIPVVPAAAVVPQADVRTHTFEFTGSSGEYFRIWIVNVFLSVITFGIYSAWAKVRTRQYFYANTRLDGHPFEYLGNPIAILKGNIVVGIGAFAYSIAQRFSPYLTIGIAAVFGLVMPYLIYQSLRFMASNSSYRNIRFRFHGKLGASYVEYFLFPLLIFVTGGLIYPYIQFRQHSYLLNNAAYGTSRNVYRGTSNHYYGVYVRVFLISLAAYAVLIGVGVAVFTSTFRTTGFGTSRTPDLLGIYVMLIPVYLVLLGLGAVLQQYVYVNIHNYMFRESGVVGKVRFVSHLDTWTMIKLQMVNLLAIIFSLGLLSPWAKVRRTQYILSSMSLISNGGIEDIVADVNEQQNAIGDAATDYFNVDFGL